MNLSINHLGPGMETEWDLYVEQHPEATFFHRVGWKRVLVKAFGHRAHYLYAEENGRIRGVLPLIQVKSLLFGNTLSSTPFCVYGGVLADNDKIVEVLLQEACSLAQTLRVDALELRNRQALNVPWPTKRLYVTFRKEIVADPEENLKAIPRKQRAMVRKGIKAGLSSEEDEGWKRLYRIYSESLRNLGTPVFSRNYLRLLREEFGQDCRVLIIQHQGRDIAGVMSFYFRNEVLPYYGGSLPVARQLKGNDFMYWELLRRSGEEGITLFDFGRSKQGTGSFSFKKNWGFEPQPLHYQYHLVKVDAIPEVNPMNPKYQLFIKGWKKMPLSIANRLGPLLAKSLG